MGIRLAAIDSHPLVRLGLAHAVAGDPGIELVGEAAGAVDGRALVAAAGPDVVTIDAMLRDADGIALARQLRADLPALGVVVLGPAGDDASLYRALHAGLSAYIARSSAVSTVLAAVRHAATAPLSFIASDLAATLARRQRPTGGLLSARELQVLELMRTGVSLPRIAVTLAVSEGTVKTYVARLYTKLRVSNRTQALMAAVNQGLLPMAARDAG